jgi:hypothetical protein
MKNKNGLKISAMSCALGAALVFGALGTGCVGAHQGTLDEIAGALGQQEPYTEAFIDYPGPSDRWAGPARFILHVTAKDKAVDVKLPAQWHPVPSNDHRAPAAVLTGDQARDKLANLATAMQEDSSSFRGCMYPIRVRLVRADGEILDKTGCRDQSRWAKTASETVDFFVAHAGK